MRMTRFEALQKVRRHFSTEQSMAEAFAVTQPTIWRWMNQSKQLPPEHCICAERMTGVSRYDLRPDIYPREAMIDHDTQRRFRGVDQHAGRVA